MAVLASTSGLPTGTGITLTIDATDSSGNPTPDVKETVNGIVGSAGEIINLVRGQDGTTAQAHATGANVVMWITSNLWNDFQAAFTAEHSQLDGTHKDITPTSVTTPTLAVSTTASLPSNSITGSNLVAGSAFKPTDVAMFRARKTTLQNCVKTDVVTTITWDSVDEYKGTTHFDVANEQFTAPADGWLEVHATISVDGGNGTDDSNAWGYTRGGLYIDAISVDWQAQTGSGIEASFTFSSAFPVSAGDIIKVSYDGTGSANTCRILTGFWSGRFTPSFT